MGKIKKGITGFLMSAVVLSVVIGGKIMLADEKDFSNMDVDSLPKEYIQAQFVYDPDSIQESVGMADYVFAGFVAGCDGTHYENIVIMEDEDGFFKKVGSPYTNYTVEVVGNIKGSLRTDTPIQIVKDGGVAYDGESVSIYENDLLPKVGQAYIFLAYAQPDGSLLVTGPNSNIHIVKSGGLDTEEILAAEEFALYQDAYEDEIIPVERERFVSKYEW